MRAGAPGVTDAEPLVTLGGVRSTASHEEAGSRHTPPSPGSTAPSGSMFASSTPLYQRFGFGSLLGRPLKQLVGRHHPCDLRGGVVEVACDDRLLGAHHDAGRLDADLDSVHAVVALLGRVLLGVDVQGVVRARLHARLAADAAVGVEVDDPVVTLVERSGGADRDARGVGAMVAPHHREEPFGVRPCTLLDVLHPGAVDSEGDLVLGLAGHRARMAADACRLVDDEPIPHRWMPSLRIMSGQ